MAGGLLVSEGPSVRAVPDAEQLPVGVMVEEVDVLVWRGCVVWVLGLKGADWRHALGGQACGW